MPAYTRTKKKVIRKDIQALRALAVASVVLYHLWPGRLQGGFTGVDIFFVVSGYLMTLSVMRNLGPMIDKKSITPRAIWTMLSGFYARRIRRLIPAALAAILGTLGLAAMTGNLSTLITNAKNALAATTFWQNWLLAQDSIDYLQQDNSIVATQHFWSLSLEEQFYLIWPLLLALSALVTIHITVLFKRNRIYGLILPVILLTIGLFGFGIWLTHENPTFAYYATPARMWQLMFGGIIALLPALKNYDLKLLLPYLGLGINLYSLFFIGIDHFPGWIAILPTVGTAMIIWAGASKVESPLAFENIFRFKPIQWLGNISYSVYLWHFPLFVLGPIIINYNLSGSHHLWIKLAIILATLVIAHLSYRFIEQPTQKIRTKDRYTYIGFIVATAAVAGFTLYIQQQAQNKIDTNLAALHDIAADQSNTCFGARAIANQDECDNPYGEIDADFTPIGKQDRYRSLIQETNIDCQGFNPNKSHKNDPAETCEFGDTSSDKSIILLGDSHADHHANALHDFGLRAGYKVIRITASECLHDISDSSVRAQALCDKRMDYMTNQATLDSSSLVIVSLLYRDFENSIEKLTKKIYENTEVPIALLQDVPYFTSRQLLTCYTTGYSCKKPRSESIEESFAPFDALTEKAKDDKRKVAQVEIDSAFCDEEYCYASIGGSPVYYDSLDGTKNSHITASYSLSMSQLLEQRLAEQRLFENNPSGRG